MTRSKWKYKFISSYILKKIFYYNLLNIKKKIIIFSRSSTIPKSLNNHYFKIHNGIFFKKLPVKNLEIGYKFGEFSLSKKLFFFPKKEKKKKKLLRR